MALQRLCDFLCLLVVVTSTILFLAPIPTTSQSIQLHAQGAWESSNPAPVLPPPYTEWPVQQLLQDSTDSRIWYISSQNGVLVWNSTSATDCILAPAPALTNAIPSALVQDSDGTVYVVYPRTSVSRLRKGIGKTAFLEVLMNLTSSPHTIADAAAGNGRLYLAEVRAPDSIIRVRVIDAATAQEISTSWAEQTSECEVRAGVIAITLDLTQDELLVPCSSEFGLFIFRPSNVSHPGKEILVSTTPVQAMRWAPTGKFIVASSEGGVTIEIDDGPSRILVSQSTCGYGFISVDSLDRIFIACASIGLTMVDGDFTTTMTSGTGICQGRTPVAVDSKTRVLYLACPFGFAALRGRTASTVIDRQECSGLRSMAVKDGDSVYVVCPAEHNVIRVEGLVMSRVDLGNVCLEPDEVEVQTNGTIFTTCFDFETGVTYIVRTEAEESDVVLLPLGDLIWMRVVEDVLYMHLQTDVSVIWQLTSHDAWTKIMEYPDALSGLRIAGMNGEVFLGHSVYDIRRLWPNGSQNFTTLLSSKNCRFNSFWAATSENNLYVACTTTVAIVSLTPPVTVSWITVASGVPGVTDVTYNPLRRMMYLTLNNIVTAVERDTLLSWQVAIDQCNTFFSIHMDQLTGTLFAGCTAGNLVAVTDEFRCAPGTNWFTNQCAQCLTGTASGRVNQSRHEIPVCVQCAPGSIAPAIGSVECALCPVGRFQSNQFAQYCSVCQIGQAQNNSGAIGCNSCGPGFISTDVAVASCSPCEPGSYSSKQESGQCILCGRGSFSNVSASSTCFTCEPGRYADNFNRSVCRHCEPGTFAAVSESSSCLPCERGRYSNITGRTTVCDECPPATDQKSPGQTFCSPCSIGEFVPKGGSCIVCPVGTFSPSLGAACLTCADPDQLGGLDCSGGIATVRSGWWPYKVPNADGVMTLKTTICPTTEQCPGGKQDPTQPIQYCNAPRLNSEDNWLCAACDESYVSWQNNCVACDSANGPLIFLVLVLGYLLVGFLLYSGDSSAGHISILLFFLQTAALEVGPVASWLNWIAFANLSAASTRSCLLPITPLQQHLLTMLTPVVLIMLLITIGLTHILIGWIWDLNNPASHTSCLHRRLTMVMAPFSIHKYIGCVVSILLFSYTSVSVAVVESLNCVTIAPGVRVLFNSPTVHCDTFEYRSFLPLVYTVLIAFCLGFPTSILWQLYRRRSDLHENFAAAEATGIDQPRHGVKFSIRWGAVYRGYTPRAWFWVPLLITRRFCFALTAVLLTSKDNSTKFALFGFLNFIGLLAHFITRPFAIEILNLVESCSYSILVCLSLLLGGISPPYPPVIQAAIFLLIIPPAAAMILWTARAQWRKVQTRLIQRKPERRVVHPDDDHLSEPSKGQGQSNGISSGVELESVALDAPSILPSSLLERRNVIDPIATMDSETETL